MTFTAAPPTKQMDGDNNNSNIPTDKYDHISSVPSGVRGSVSSYLQEKKRHTHTHSHWEIHARTRTHRKVIKQAKTPDPQRPGLGHTDRQLKPNRQPLRPGSCSGANGCSDFFPGSPSLPPAAAVVLLYVLLLSSSHNPFAGALGRCLPFLSALIMTLTSCCREPPTCCCSQETPRLP